MNPLLLEYFLSPWVMGLFGLTVGSFLNVVIHRLPLMLESAWQRESSELLGLAAPVAAELSLASPRSRCPSCKHVLAWHENVPVFSYLRLGAKCSSCKVRIPFRYPSIEILTGFLFAAVAWRLGPVPEVLLWCGFMAALVALSGIDWDTTLLPDNMTLPLMWAGLVAAGLGWTIPIEQSLWGAVGGYMSLWTVYWIFKLITGKEGMGFGDFKLLAALGAWLGVYMLLPIVLVASSLGAVVGIVMKLGGQLREGRYVPFGPFLAGAGVVMMLSGQKVVLSWLGWG